MSPALCVTCSCPKPDHQDRRVEDEFGTERYFRSYGRCYACDKCRMWVSPTRRERVKAKKLGDKAQQQVAKAVNGRVQPVAGGTHGDFRTETHLIEVKARKVKWIEDALQQCEAATRGTGRRSAVAVVDGQSIYIIERVKDWVQGGHG